MGKFQPRTLCYPRLHFHKLTYHIGMQKDLILNRIPNTHMYFVTGLYTLKSHFKSIKNNEV